MEKHYTKNMGEITYVYGVNLEEHGKVIEKQRKRISELEQDLEFTTKTANELIEIKHKLEQELAEKDKELEKLKQQLEEKDKEIEKLKTKQKPIVMHSKENYYFLEEENIKLHFAQKQLAIQELEKVKNKCNRMYELWLDSNYKENMYNNEDIAGVFEDISVFTNDLIKKLKGE